MTKWACINGLLKFWGLPNFGGVKPLLKWLCGWAGPALYETTPAASRSTGPTSPTRALSRSTLEKDKDGEENQICGGESRNKKIKK
jgi:hypothetical protein